MLKIVLHILSDVFSDNVFYIISILNFQFAPVSTFNSYFVII